MAPSNDAVDAESLHFRTAEGTKLLGGGRHHVVEIVPEEVSGRRFCLSQPWEHVLPAE